MKPKLCKWCGHEGQGSPQLKEVKNGKSKKTYHFWYCAHYLTGNRVKWYYIGKRKVKR